MGYGPGGTRGARDRMPRRTSTGEPGECHELNDIQVNTKTVNNALGTSEYIHHCTRLLV